MSSEVTYSCDLCPRTFKLEEFFEKHKKVHELKKQHKCHVCGFVYGAAKGLEGHLKTHSEEEQIMQQAKQIDFHFLNRRGVLGQATLAGGVVEEVKKEQVKVMEEETEKKISPGQGGSGTYQVYGECAK